MVGSQIAIAKILADFNLAVHYRIAIHIIYVSKKFRRALIWQLQRQTAKPPNLIFRLYGIILVRKCLLKLHVLVVCTIQQ